MTRRAPQKPPIKIDYGDLGKNLMLNWAKKKAQDKALEYGGEVLSSQVAPSSSSFLGSLGGAGATAGLAGMAALWGKTGYNSYKDLMSDDQGRKTTGALKGLAMTNMLTAPLAIGADLLGLSLNSGKDADQNQRDEIREYWQKKKILDDDYNVTLANGGKYNIGIEDRNEFYKGQPFNLHDESGTVLDDTGADSETTGQTIGALDPLSYIMTGGSERAGNFTGYLTKAVQSEGDINDNVMAQYEAADLDRNKAAQATHHLFDTGKIDEGRRDAHLAAIDRIFASGE